MLGISSDSGNNMRLSIIISFIFLLLGCQLTTPLAPILMLPQTPKLNSEDIQFQYVQINKKSSAQIKSVQLPAHKISKNQTIAFDLSKAKVDYDLAAMFNAQFKQRALLPVVDTANAEYRLTLNKISHKNGNETHFEIKNKQKLKFVPNNDLMTRTCASLDTIISLRLTHTQSGDVVWFAQGSINSANYPAIPLVYKLHVYQEITNKQQISAFITNNNTEAAREIRANNAVSIPAYNIATRTADFVKVSGACSQIEADDLSENISLHLIKTLVNKLKISDIKI